MSSYLLTAPAARDIDEILDYIAGQSVQNAVLVARRFEKAFSRIAAFPNLGHRRDDLNDPTAQAYFVSGYLVIYDPSLHPLHVLRVLRGARNLKRASIR